MNLVYTDEAIEDLKRLREFIAVHNPSAAGNIAAELITKIELLPELPRMGSQVKLAPGVTVKSGVWASSSFPV